MILTCENCGTQYNLDPTKIGEAGRRVRCTKCQSVWFVNQQGEVSDKPHKAETPPTVAPPSAPAPAEEIVVEAPVLESLPATKNEKLPAAHAETIPPAVRPASIAQDISMAVMDHKPGGMGAGQFGLSIFLVLLFSTLIVLFVARNPITHRLPAMAGLYKVIGLPVAAPGEGLQLSEMSADMGRVRLDVSARLANVSSQRRNYPALRITLKSAYGAVLKKWDMQGDAGMLDPGQSVPVSISLDDFPPDGKSVEMSVIGN